MKDDTTTVLLLEDEPAQRRLMRRLLVHTGFDVIDVGTVDAGVDAYLLYAPDLVISDFELGDGTANDFMERSGCESSRCIVVTGHPSPPLPEQVNYLSKPVDFERFFAMVGEAVQPLGSATSVSWAEAGRGIRPSRRPTVTPVPTAQFVLYLTPGAPSSELARRQILSLLAARDMGEVHVAICELREGEAAPVGPEQVVFTPALVRVRPGPRAWIVGDLGDEERLRDFFALDEVRRKKRQGKKGAGRSGEKLSLDAG